MKTAQQLLVNALKSTGLIITPRNTRALLKIKIALTKISKSRTLGEKKKCMLCVILERVTSKYGYVCKARLSTIRLYQNQTISPRTTKAASSCSHPV